MSTLSGDVSIKNVFWDILSILKGPDLYYLKASKSHLFFLSLKPSRFLTTKPPL